MDFLIFFATVLISIGISFQNITPSDPTTKEPTIPVVKTLEEKFSDVKYCDLRTDELCINQENILIGCDKPTSENCKSMKIENIADKIPIIVDTHNNLRRRFAYARYANLKNATKMKKVLWDEELQYLATVLLKDCITGSDIAYCYLNSKQEKLFANFGTMDLSPGSNPTNVMENILDGWKLEKTIDQFSLTKTQYLFNNDFVNLAYMVHDQVNKIGCAAGTFRSSSGNKVGLICLYDKYLKARESFIYKAGSDTCSACKDYGENYECSDYLCHVPKNIVTKPNGNGTYEVDIGPTLLNTIGNYFNAILIGGAIVITVITIAASYIKIRFCV